MMLSIAIKVAIWLIQYLLKTNWQLGEQLQEAKDRVIEHQKALTAEQDQERLLLKEIDAARSRAAQLGYQLNELGVRIDEMRKEHDEKTQRIKDFIADTSDDDILRSTVGSGTGGESGNPPGPDNPSNGIGN